MHKVFSYYALLSNKINKRVMVISTLSTFSFEKLNISCSEMFHERSRSTCPEVFYKKGVLRCLAKFTGKDLCQSLFCRPACNFIKKETMAQTFSCQFCEISKNTFSYRTPPVTASEGQKENSITYKVYISWNFLKEKFYCVDLLCC